MYYFLKDNSTVKLRVLSKDSYLNSVEGFDFLVSETRTHVEILP